MTCEFIEDTIVRIERIIEYEQFKMAALRLSEDLDWRPNYPLPEDYYAI